MTEVKSEKEMELFGERLGSTLCGGEVIELVGDVGAGKTTLVHGMARGLGVNETVASPSFTINRVYDARDNLHLVHYDFYRLDDPGIMAAELAESLNDKQNTVVIEWAGAVENTLPSDRLTIQITNAGENKRDLRITSGGSISRRIEERLK